MTAQTIDQFIWGYQEHFQRGLRFLANDVLAGLGAEAKVETFLVATLRSGDLNRHDVCVQPETDSRLVHLFADLRERVVAAEPRHELQNMFYGHEPTMRDKPENIWRLVTQDQVQQILVIDDETQSNRSFAGLSVSIAGYDVVPVIQVPKTLFDQFPPLKTRSRNGMKIFGSLVEAAIIKVLEEAQRHLEGRHPGRFMDDMRSASEIIQVAASSFLRGLAVLIEKGFEHTDFYRALNDISMLAYERNEGVGRMLLIDPAHPQLDYIFRFVQPIPLRDRRWARKILEMARGDTAIIANNKAIHGLGQLSSQHDTEQEDAFWVDFLGHHQWSFRKSGQALMRCRDGKPLLPQDPISQSRFIDNCERVLKSCDAQRLWDIFQALMAQERGAMLMIGEDAQAEAERLSGQGTAIAPQVTGANLIEAAVRIDGTILIDPFGRCHAVGVILDGPANEQCSASRGSRYNSAVRYVDASTVRRLAVTISEDYTIDIYPLLRPRIDRNLIENQLHALETATIENFYDPRNFINENRFYLTPEQCERANAALVRINHLPAPWNMIKWTTTPLEPDPEMNEGYYL